MVNQIILHDQKTIHFKYAGSGPAVVLLHGFLESLSIWDEFTETLSQTNTVITIDLPGHGKSDVLADVQTMEMMADSVKAVLDSLKIETCAMVGHSMGGYVTLSFANAYPDMLSGFCLFNSTALEDGPQKKKDRVRAVKVILMNPKVFINEAIPNLFAPGNVERFADDIARVKAEALQTSIAGITACLLGMKDRADQLEFVRNYQKPILYIVGKQDPVMPFEKMTAQINANENTQALVLENVGHMGFLEARKETLERLCEFVESLKTVTST